MRSFVHIHINAFHSVAHVVAITYLRAQRTTHRSPITAVLSFLQRGKPRVLFQVHYREVIQGVSVVVRVHALPEDFVLTEEKGRAEWEGRQ